MREFVSPAGTFKEDRGHDLNRSAPSLVNNYANARATTCPDLPWEPKESFRAVAAFYAARGGGR